MIGALFILVLLAVAFGFSLVMFDSFTGYQNAVDTRALYNSQVPREDLSYSSVIFGASSSHNPTGYTFPTTISSTEPARFYPITNMNFTASSSGWVFTRRYIAGSFGMTGNFDPVTSIGSQSGPGEIYVDFINNGGGGTTLNAIGNWTTLFTLTPSEVTDLSAGTSTAAFWLGDILWVDSGTGSSSATVSFYLVDATTGATATIASFTATNLVWSLNHYAFSSLAAQHTFFSATSSTDTFELVISTNILLKTPQSGVGEIKVYFDDTGVALTLTNYYSATVCPTFSVSPENPLSIQDLTVSVQSSYTQPVTQIIYLYDFTQSSLTQVDTATVSTSTATRYVDLGGLVGGASQVQAFVQTQTATVTVAGCGNISTTPGEVIMKIYSIESTPGTRYSGTLSADVLTDYYTDTSHLSMRLLNSGTTTIHLVSLWITGTSGATHFASTLSGPSFFEEWIGPGQTVSISLAYDWSPGEYTIEVVTALGNVFSVSEIAP